MAQAEQRLIRACMARRGFAYPAMPAQPEPPASTPPSLTDGYRLYAAFRHRRAGVSEEPQARIARHVRSLRKRERASFVRALEGGESTRYRRTEGCAARATRRLWGDLRRFYEYVETRNAVVDDLSARLDSDRSLAYATAVWHRCMTRRGMRYETPEEARFVLYSAYLSSDPEDVRGRELATAKADRACAGPSQIYEEAMRAQRRALSALPRPTLFALDAAARHREAAADRARSAL